MSFNYFGTYCINEDIYPCVPSLNHFLYFPLLRLLMELHLVPLLNHLCLPVLFTLSSVLFYCPWYPFQYPSLILFHLIILQPFLQYSISFLIFELFINCSYCLIVFYFSARHFRGHRRQDTIHVLAAFHFQWCSNKDASGNAWRNLSAIVH